MSKGTVDDIYELALARYAANYPTAQTEENHLKDGKRERDWGFLIGVTTAAIANDGIPVIPRVIEDFVRSEVDLARRNIRQRVGLRE